MWRSLQEGRQRSSTRSTVRQVLVFSSFDTSFGSPKEEVSPTDGLDMECREELELDVEVGHSVAPLG